jgi:hypothetical protein
MTAKFGFNNLLLADFNEELLQIIAYIALAFGGLVVLYAMYLGFLMATASDAGKRAEAKRRVLNAIAIVIILIALVGLLRVINTQTGSVYEYEIQASGWTLSVVVASNVPSADRAALTEKLNNMKSGLKFEFATPANGWTISTEAGKGIIREDPNVAKADRATSVSVKCTYNGSVLTQTTSPIKLI